MTNSTAPEKKTRKKGPFRTEAVVPSVVLLALIYAYFYFFFDDHLRRGLEYVATQVHGAEVDIGDIDTSLWKASFRLKNLEVTDKQKPERNLFAVGEIHFQMLWDALLRAKAVVEDASVLNVQAYTPRKKPGRVLPPPPPGSSLIGKVQEQVMAQTRQRLNGNFLGDIANVLGGVDPKEELKNIQADLKSTARAEALEKEIVAKKAEWEKRIKELPKPQDVKALEQKIKALNLKTKNPVELAQNLKRAKEILGEAQAKVKQVEESQRDLSGDINNYTQAVASLQKLADEDVRDLQKRLQIPGIDPKEFSTQLFLGQIEQRLVSMRKYVAVVRKYMPPKKTEAQKKADQAEALVPRARGEGLDFRFPVTKGYPLFWLKKAAVSSELTQSDWAGKVSGEIRNFTTAPSELGLPFEIDLKGDFPKQKIAGLHLLGTIDHTKETAKESLKAEVASFPVAEQVFSDSAQVRFGLKEAVGEASLAASLSGDNLSLSVKNRFEHPSFLLEAKQKQLEEILQNVAGGISLVTMNANVSGSWDKFHIDVESNLGKALSDGFQKQLQAKLGDAKAKLDAFVKSKVEPAKKKAEAQLAALTSGPAKALGQEKSVMDSALKGAEGSAKGGSGGGALDKGKSLLKGFGL